MLNASALYDIKVKFYEPQAPTYQLSSSDHKIEEPLESTVVGAYRRKIFVEVRAEKEYRPYY